MQISRVIQSSGGEITGKVEARVLELLDYCQVTRDFAKPTTRCSCQCPKTTGLTSPVRLRVIHQMVIADYLCRLWMCLYRLLYGIADGTSNGDTAQPCVFISP